MILPSVVFKIPERVSKRVVFPAPLGPKRETISPCFISREISLIAGKGPYWTVSFFILSIRLPVYDKAMSNVKAQSSNEIQSSNVKNILDFEL
jgi:hypothetical protein